MARTSLKEIVQTRDCTKKGKEGKRRECDVEGVDKEENLGEGRGEKKRREEGKKEEKNGRGEGGRKR